ncbi:guanylate kinase [Emcibacter nanhaiensis]|uniref:Guanylate kinase n=1 Tax=Emcibacter nanhaiensis TaxID=1505037 RepID=A0A501PS70_9PROT|nr:guanylate kinase [Emcibacter nanhaiensis]TPD62957.1 guanylate kinase [Emcibacter nanhaiensis]
MSSKALSMDIKRRGLLLVLSSPSGAGKSTLSRLLLEKDDQITMSISTTTREPRPGEADGVDYNFVTIPEFEDLVAQDGFLEHARVFDNYYGTPAAPVEKALQQGRDILFDIDWQGTQQLAQKAKGDLVRVFILPPSKDELERRLRARAQDTDEVVAKRMSKANQEISHWAEYDYIIVNEDLDQAEEELFSILKAERLKRERQTGLLSFVKDLMGEED